jgi:hypothetical protein
MGRLNAAGTNAGSKPKIFARKAREKTIMEFTRYREID